MVDLKLQAAVPGEVKVDAETLDGIDRGLKDVNEGRAMSLDEARKMIPKWISKFEVRTPR